LLNWPQFNNLFTLSPWGQPYDSASEYNISSTDFGEWLVHFSLASNG
jgi:hypothetical protein